jgi:protein-S-isoprenylcysteine O-methyltransferase Ste14
MKFLEHRVPPPVVAVIAAAGMWVLASYWPMVRFEVPAPALIGLTVALIGGLIAGAGARTIRQAKTTVSPLHPDKTSSIVTRGIYGYTRNPMYVGLVFVLLGCFVGFGGMSAALGLVAFILYITRFQIEAEERILEAKFGKDYVAYKARVRRWL